jgi:hypothetical protein
MNLPKPKVLKVVVNDKSAGFDPKRDQRLAMAFTLTAISSAVQRLSSSDHHVGRQVHVSYVATCFRLCFPYFK